MSLVDVATAVGVLVAIALGAVSWRQARAANNRAVTANEHAATANTIAQEALEVARGQLTLNERAAAASERWQLVRLRGDLLELTNTSADDARHVMVHPPEHAITRGDLEHEVIRAGSSVTFMIARSMGSDWALTITWAAHDGSPQQWTRALPPKA